MAKSKEELLIQLKFGFCFHKLLTENDSEESSKKSIGNRYKIPKNSLGQLSSETGLRKATLSNVFTGNSNIKATTIDLILKGLAKSLVQFAVIYDSITDKEINDYKEFVKQKKRRKKK